VTKFLFLVTEHSAKEAGFDCAGVLISPWPDQEAYVSVRMP